MGSMGLAGRLERVDGLLRMEKWFFLTYTESAMHTWFREPASIPNYLNVLLSCPVRIEAMSPAREAIDLDGLGPQKT